MLDIEERGGAVVVHMRQAPVNVLRAAMLKRLAAAVDFAGDSRAVVLTGYRSTFAVGTTASRTADSAAEAADLLASQHQLLRALVDRRGPVVAAINGDALDAGFALAAAADIRLMTRGTIGTTSRACGGDALTPAARDVIAEAAGPLAASMLLNGAVRTAHEAAASRLIDRVTTPCRLLDEAITTSAMLTPV